SIVRAPTETVGDGDVVENDAHRAVGIEAIEARVLGSGADAAAEEPAGAVALPIVHAVFGLVLLRRSHHPHGAAPAVHQGEALFQCEDEAPRSARRDRADLLAELDVLRLSSGLHAENATRVDVDPQEGALARIPLDALAQLRMARIKDFGS